MLKRASKLVGGVCVWGRGGRLQFLCLGMGDGEGGAVGVPDFPVVPLCLEVLDGPERKSHGPDTLVPFGRAGCDWWCKLKGRHVTD